MGSMEAGNGDLVKIEATLDLNDLYEHNGSYNLKPRLTKCTILEKNVTRKSNSGRSEQDPELKEALSGVMNGIFLPKQATTPTKPTNPQINDEEIPF